MKDIDDIMKKDAEGRIEFLNDINKGSSDIKTATGEDTIKVKRLETLVACLRDHIGELENTVGELEGEVSQLENELENAYEGGED